MPTTLSPRPRKPSPSKRLHRDGDNDTDAISYQSSAMNMPPMKRRRLPDYDRRPRLSICPSVSPDAELVEDRDRNDNTLKGKFEAIFEKYGRDFTDVGDEIDVITGEVIVDNGHILSMHHETDPGSPTRALPSVSREGTMAAPMARTVRALTLGREDVIASIEAMGRRIAAGQTPFPEDEEEDDGDNEDIGIERVNTYQRSGSVSSDSLFGSDEDDDEVPLASQTIDLFPLGEKLESRIDSRYKVQPSIPAQAVRTNQLLMSKAKDVSGYSAFAPSVSPQIVSFSGKKAVSKRLNVSKAFEELQRKAASLTPGPDSASGIAIAVPHATTKSASLSSKSVTNPPIPSPPTQQPPNQSDEFHSKMSTRLKKLPVARLSSEPPMLDDYESDDPLH